MEEIKKLLGKPYYFKDNILLYKGDSLKILKSLNNKKLIDATITSPPYNIGKEYEKNLPHEEYLSWSENWIKLVHDVSKDNSSFWLNLGYYSIENKAKAIPIIYQLWDKIPFYLIQEIVWNYGAGVAAKHSFSPRNEKFLWYVKNSKDYQFYLDKVRDPNVKYPNQKKNGKIKVNPLGKNPSDVWYIPKVTSGKNRSSKERTPHPAQFPIELINRIMVSVTKKNQLVLDPFLGSGTTAVSARLYDRKFLGIEIDEKYLKITVNRIEKDYEIFKKNNQQLNLGF
jgi:adenine-specific DNA-methyltransferase